MTTERNVVDFKIHNLTEEQFQELKEAGQIDPNAIYCTPDMTKVRLDALEENKQDVATAVNYGHVTNCITEIPQDIKLELNNGTLTLKAGSKVYVPNGSSVFDELIIQNDLTATTTTNEKSFIFVRNDGLGIDVLAVANCGSGASPTPTNYSVQYDMRTNLCKLYTTNLTVQDRNVSFPVAICQGSSSGFSSIDQVFNGFGYIGSTAFALPGVKGLIPDGRNEDGTLKNIEFESTKVTTTNFLFNNRYNLAMTTSGKIDRLAGFRYDPEHNYNYNYDWESTTCICGVCTIDNDRIISFTPKTAFHAVDYNDTEFIAHQAMPSDKYIDLTLGASGATYTAPADGWFFLSKKSGVSDGWMSMEIVNGSMGCITAAPTANNSMTVSVPVKKGDVVIISYTFAGTTNVFRFVYAEGAK